MTSLQELASFNGSVHDDAINRFLEIVVPDTSLYGGRPLSWVPSTFTTTLGCTGDQATGAEATALVNDMARELHGRHLEGTTLVPMHISSGHWVLVTVNKVDSTHEITILDSLGAHRAQTRLLQAQQLATWFQSQHAEATTAVFKFNPRFLPLYKSSFILLTGQQLSATDRHVPATSHHHRTAARILAVSSAGGALPLSSPHTPAVEASI